MFAFSKNPLGKALKLVLNFLVVYLQQSKKKAKAEGKKCHAKNYVELIEFIMNQSESQR